MKITFEIDTEDPQAVQKLRELRESKELKDIEKIVEEKAAAGAKKAFEQGSVWLQSKEKSF